MAAPNPNIVSISRTKIGNKTGVDRATVIINFDIPIQAYTLNALGVSWDTGTVVDKGSRYVQDIKNTTVSSVKTRTVKDVRQIDASVNISNEVDFTELYQEGTNRINIYGQGLDGTWTPYTP